MIQVYRNGFIVYDSKYPEANLNEAAYDRYAGNPENHPLYP